MAALSLTVMAQAGGDGKTWVDYVNPYIGNISHLLIPTFPTVQLPNSMLRVYPERADFTADRINGLPLIVTHHREHSAFNLSVYCGDIGSPYYTDDWIWDTYRATHPLRVLLEAEKERDIIRSFVTMAQQTDSLWLPTFPESTGDSRRMNSNHTVAVVADALSKGITDFDVNTAYCAARNVIYNKSLAPWSANTPAGWLNAFYVKHGYIPALRHGEKEYLPEVNSYEKRQPIAVTLGTSYDEWCLSRIAAYLGKTSDSRYYENRSLNYRNVFNPETRFFHPKDSAGEFIKPFDYIFDGGMGARDFYGENNG